MEPSQLAQHSDPTNIALVFGAIMATIKAIEKGAAHWLQTKRRKEDKPPLVCQLDPSASAAIAEILRKVSNVEAVVATRDGDGTPLVYFPRSLETRLTDQLDDIQTEMRRRKG